jgi:hypothetical protein
LGRLGDMASSVVKNGAKKACARSCIVKKERRIFVKNYKNRKGGERKWTKG